MNKITETKPTTAHALTKLRELIAKSAGLRHSIALLALGLLLTTVPRVTAQTKLSVADNDFVLAAAQGGMTEVKLGELAAQKAVRDDVKAFGQMMVKDHSAINADLKALAALKGVTLPEGLDVKHQRMVDKMAALTGSGFDDAYVADMVKGHKKDSKSFKVESAKTEDADIKSFLDKSIPVVDEHLRRIAALKK